MTSRKVEREFSDTGHKSVTEKEEVRQSHNLYDVICECPLNIPGKQKAYPIKHLSENRFGAFHCVKGLKKLSLNK